MGEPRQISEYRVVDVLGRGGMGVVYEAVHASGAQAAVKTVRVATESTLESIRREILMLRDLEHPGVVRIRDHGVAADGMPWYAMELLRGRTLRDDLRVWFPEPVKPDDSTKDLKAPGRQRARDDTVARAPAASTPPYSLAHVAGLFAKICEPLAYVHGQGVIHRDLSPGNIFLVGPDDPVLFDFGLASQFHPDGAREVLEVGGYARGTVHYMAPEQARGEVVDARADIYALGCILYEALTGRPPFIDEGGTSVLLQHLEAPPVPPSERVRATAPFDELLLRMLAKSPRDRIGYVDDVAAALSSGRRRPKARAYTYRPRLAGRAEIIAEIQPYIARVAGGIGCGAALIGESGAGKTRLAGEIATRAASQWDLRVITGECQPVAVGEDVRAAPLHPLRPLLRAIADRCREGGRTESERLLGVDGGLLVAYEPALAGFAKTIDRVGVGAMSGAAQRHRVLSVLRDVVAALTVAEPVLLVIDDLQWADELTLAFLRSLTQPWFARTALMVLVTVRADEVSAELSATLASLRAERYPVTRLGRDAVGAMVKDMLALDEDVPALADYVAKRSEGNPLFAAEYLRIAVEDGVVERDGAGRWRLAARDDESYDHLPTPGSVQELGRRRLGMLSSDARELAIAAAVLGRACEPDVLTRTASRSSESARGGVAELILRRVVEEVDGQLRFEHDSLRELAYAELTDDERRALHRRAALAVEERHGADADFGLRLAELAHHWEQAGDLARALDYLDRAADHALDTAAYGEARTLLDRLLALAPEAPAVKRGRWLRRIGEAAYALGDVEGLAVHSRAALEALGRPLPASRARLAATIASGLGQQLWSRTLRRRAPAAPAEPELAEAALASAQMTTHFFFNDDSLGLVGAALTAANLAERGGDELPIAEIYAQLGYAAGLARLGGIARTYFAQAEATAARTRDTLGLVRTRMCEAAFAIGTGAWHDARRAGGEALRLSRQLRNPQEAEDALTILGHAEFATGHYDASRALAIELRDSARGRANVQHEAWGIYTEGRTALYTGDLDHAIERLSTAMPIVASLHDRASQILCGGMLAAALARRGDARAGSVADATWDRIGGRTPPVFSITEGLVGLCDAYLELTAREPALVPRARAAIAELAKLARLLPIAGPPAENRLGRLYALTGARRRSARAFEKGSALARRLSMPFEESYAARFASPLR
ncbi:MAG: protein kinase [Myxococcales bacterium]|nr:protein kinase [Myxococcales bacterium]